MIDLSRLIIIPLVALSVALSGCDKHDHEHGSDHSHAHGDDHHHDGDDHDHDGDHHHDGDDHDHGDDGHDHADDHHHDGEHVLTHTIEVGGVVLSMEIEGEPAPNAEIHVEMHHANGLMPEAVRLWYGPKSGEGAMKTKADAHDDHWHAHVECPGTITDQDSLWVEVEDADGNRIAKGIKL